MTAGITLTEVCGFLALESIEPVTRCPFAQVTFSGNAARARGGMGSGGGASLAAETLLARNVTFQGNMATGQTTRGGVCSTSGQVHRK